jgi:hypothetical protein
MAPLKVGKANRATTIEAEKKLSINRPDLEILPGTPPFVFDPMLMYNSPLSPNTILFKALAESEQRKMSRHQLRSIAAFSFPCFKRTMIQVGHW